LARPTALNSVRPFTQNVLWVTVGHIAVVFLLFLLPLVSSLMRPKSEPMTPIDFVVNPETEKGEAAEPEPEPEKATPEPAPKSVPHPEETVPALKPEPAPKKTPEAKPKAKPDKPKVQVSTKKVKQKVGTPNPLTPEEIRRRLALGARIGTYNSAIPSEEMRNFNLIHQALYQAWVQPSADSAGKPTAVARIRLDRTGRIIESGLERTSGVAEFDNSVLQALKAVDRVDGLTVSFLERHATVTVLFELE